MLDLSLEKPEMSTTWNNSGAISALRCSGVIVRYVIQEGGLRKKKKKEILK